MLTVLASGIVPALYEGPESLVPPGALGGALVWFLCVGVLGIGASCAIAVAWLRAHALDARQQREHELLRERAARSPSEGPGRVVRGRVELDGEDDLALEIEIVQAVRNHSARNGQWHTWTEVSRVTRVGRPFYLVSDAGHAVYVEPSEDVLLLDRLTTTYPMDRPNSRLRDASVRRGELLYAYGDLHRGLHPRAAAGYREGEGWILRRPRATRMLLAAEGVEDRYARRTRFLRRSATALAAAWCIFHVLFTARFLPAVALGEHTDAEIVDAQRHVMHPRGRPRAAFTIKATTSDGFSLEQEVTSEAYQRVTLLQRCGKPVTVPMTRTRDWERASYLGDRPYVYAIPLVLGLMATLFVVIVLWRAYEATFAWYDRKKLVERGGDGHWIETRPRSPIPADAN